MNIDDIQLLYEYNYWANRRIVATCAALSEAQYAAANSDGSLRATLIHVLDAEWSWRRVCKEYFVTPENASAEARAMREQLELTEAELPTLHALQQRWNADEREMRAYLKGLSDADLNGIVRYAIPGGIVRERTLWHCLLHVVNHGTQHRSEAAVMLTRLGHSPDDFDFTLFLNKHFNLPS